MTYVQEPTHLDQIDFLYHRVEQLSFFIRKLGRDPTKAYTSDPGRSGSGSSSGGAGVHGAGPLTSYRLDMNFIARGPNYEDLGRVNRFDDTSTFIDQLDFILD